MNIHVAREEQEFGPYGLDAINVYLKDGSLLATDLAWHEGLPEWLPLSQIFGVQAPSKAQVPPPRPKRPSAQTAASIEETKWTSKLLGIILRHPHSRMIYKKHAKAINLTIFGIIAAVILRFIGAFYLAHPREDGSVEDSRRDYSFFGYSRAEIQSAERLQQQNIDKMSSGGYTLPLGDPSNAADRQDEVNKRILRKGGNSERWTEPAFP